MLDVSRTTIYNRRKDFLDLSEKEGILMAAEHYEVEDTLEKLSTLARLLESNGLEIHDAVQGCEVINLLKSFEATNPESFITDVMNASNEAGITGDEITRYSLELKNLNEKWGKSYSQLIEEMEKKKNQNNELEEQLKDVREKLKNDSENLETQLEESKITREKLDEFNDTISDLESVNINIEDITRLESLVKNMKQHDYIIEEIIDFYDSTLILKESIGRKKEDNASLEEKNKLLKKENDQLEVQLNSNLSLLSAIKNLEKKEIDPKDILAIISTVTIMSRVLNISERDAVDRFIEDIQTQYNERSNYRFQLEELENLHSVYKEKSNLLKEELDVLEEVLRDRKTSIGSLKKIETLGISDQEIAEWSKLVEQLGYDVSEFRLMLKEVGGLPGYRDVKMKELRELEGKEKRLQENIKELEVELASLKDTLFVIRKTFEEETSKVTKAVYEFYNYFNSPETGFKVRSKELIDEVASDLNNLLVSTKDEWRSDLEALDRNVSKVVEETQRILENAYKGGRIVGHFHSIEPIYKILREEEVPIIEATISIITMLTYIQNWLKKNTQEVDPVFDEVIMRLMEDLRDIY